MAEVRYQFFLSSTFEDLRRERQQVVEAILELGHIPVGMEVFPAADETPWEIIKRTIEESDYYIVLSAGRYGSCDRSGKSYTEREFDLALELAVPIIGFLAEKPFDRPESQREDSPEARRKLEAFHGKIRDRHVRTWTSTEELGLQASKAIIHATRNYPRTGWVRADKAKSLDDFRQVDALRSQLEVKEAQIHSLEAQLDEADALMRQTVLSGEEIQPELLSSGDERVAVPVKYTLNGQKYDEGIMASWDKLFELIAPRLYNVRMRRDYAGKFEFERDISLFLKEEIGIEGSTTQLRIRPRFIDAMLFQFKQLGLVMLESGENGEAWWTLTPRGESHMTKLIVTFRS